MRAAIVGAGLALTLGVTPALPERSDVDMYASLRPSLLSPTPVHAQDARVRPPRAAPDPALVRIVERAADQAGVSRDDLRFVVGIESGWRPDARNPRSTATGLTQVVHASHAAIIGRRITREEHHRLMKDPHHAARVGAAHWRMCRDLVGRDASVRHVWRSCYYAGPANVGGRIEMAAAHFRTDAAGWLQRDSIGWLGSRI